MLRSIHRFIGVSWFLASLTSTAVQVQWSPERPAIQDQIDLQISNCTTGGFLHWGVNARKNQWEEPDPAYLPSGSGKDGKAIRTRLNGPDTNGVCRARLGPFNDPRQAVRSVDFAILWDDGAWENQNGRDYHIDLSNRRLMIAPAAPTLNDRMVVTVQRSRPGGELRWGVNAIEGQWTPPDARYWPTGTVATSDGLAVDSPIPPPGTDGLSRIVLGPFNSGAQVVTSLHMAVHWGKEWDTDLGRNYNATLHPPLFEGKPPIEILCPANDSVFFANMAIVVEKSRPGPITLWIDGKPLLSLLRKPLEWMMNLDTLPYGPHRLTAQCSCTQATALASVDFWYVPQFQKHTARPEWHWGASSATNGMTSFVLYAPGKHFVSVLGDFNGWSPRRGAMNCSTDGVWWLSWPLDPGTYKYQYLVDGKIRLADPYSTDVEWKDEAGREAHRPEQAFSVLKVGATPFAWTDQSFQRPPPERLLIYEFSFDDLTQGAGFTGALQRLDYLRDLGVTALEPMPVQEFTGALSWGYNPSFHFAPETVHGTPTQLKAFIDEAHRKDLAVIFDLVLNHMDSQSPLFQLYGKDYEASPYFYRFEGENWGFPDLDQESPAFKQYVSDLLQFWVRDYHVDGFRYDATRWVGWQGYNDWGAGWFAWAAKQADSNTYQIAEHLPSDPELMNRTEMDTNWDSEFRWRIREMLQRAELNSNHFIRVMTPSLLGYSNALQRVVYTESHDEERVVRDLQHAGFNTTEILHRAESALVLTLTAPGIPMIYAGQEFGEDTPKNVGQNFLHWDKLDTPTGQRLLQSARRLLQLRSRHPALTEERITFSFPTPHTVIYTRGSDPASSVVVAVNFGREEDELFLSLPGPTPWRNELEQETLSAAGMVSFRLAPGQSVVFSTAPAPRNPPASGL